MAQQTKLDYFAFSKSDSQSDTKYISFARKDQNDPPVGKSKKGNIEERSSSSEPNEEEDFVLADKPVILSPPSEAPISPSSSSSPMHSKPSRKLFSRSKKRTIQSSSSSGSDQDHVRTPAKRDAKTLKRLKRVAAKNEASTVSDQSELKIQAASTDNKVEPIIESIRNQKGKGKSEGCHRPDRADVGAPSPLRLTKPPLSSTPPSRRRSATTSLFGSSPPGQAPQSQLIIRPPIEDEYDSDLIVIDDSPPTSPVKSTSALQIASTRPGQSSAPSSPPPAKVSSNSRLKAKKPLSEPLVKPGHSRIIKKTKPTQRARTGYVTASSSSDSSSEEVYKPTSASRMYKSRNRTGGLPSSSEDDSEGPEEVSRKKKVVVTQGVKKDRIVVSEDDLEAVNIKKLNESRPTLKSISNSNRRDENIEPSPSLATVPKADTKNGSKQKKSPDGSDKAQSSSNNVPKPISASAKPSLYRSENTPDLFLSSPDHERFSESSKKRVSSEPRPGTTNRHRSSSEIPSRYEELAQMDDASLDLETRLSKAYTPITVETAPLDSSPSQPSKPSTTRQRLSTFIVSSKEVALNSTHRPVSVSKRVLSSTSPKAIAQSSVTSSDPLAGEDPTWLDPSDITLKNFGENEKEQGAENRLKKPRSGKGSEPSKQRVIVTSEEEIEDEDNPYDSHFETNNKSKRQKRNYQMRSDASDSDEESETRDSTEGVNESEVEDLEDDQGKLRIVEARMRSAEDRKSKQALARQSALERLKHKKKKKRGSSLQISSAGSSSTDEILDPNNVWAKDEEGDWIVSEDDGNDGYITDGIEDEDYASLMPMEFRSDASQPMDQCFHVICQWHIHYIIQGRPFLKLSVNNDYFRIPMLRLREKMTDVKNQVASQIWPSSFNLSLQTYPIFTGGAIKDAPPCAACRMTNRPATREIVLKGNPYNKKTFKDLDANWGRKGPPENSYNVGKYCYARAHKFHELAHWEHNLHHALVHVLQVLRKATRKEDDDDDEDEDIVVVDSKKTVKIAGKVEHVDSLPGYNRPDKVTEWLQKRNWIKQEWLNISDLLLCNENLNAPWKKTD